MFYSAILDAYSKFRSRKGLRWISPSSLVNEVDRKAFNYSLEEPILREYGSYTSFNGSFSFSTIQPCIRGADIGRIKKNATRDHLVLFHIFPTSFRLSPNPADLISDQREAISDLVEFLSSVGLDLSKLRVTYFAGGELNVLSKGTVPVKKSFPKDHITRDSFLECGLKTTQLEPISSLDTFVATFAGEMDFLAGNRFEIYYPLRDGHIVEIATGEALGYRQVRLGGATVDILPFEGSATPIVIGLERLLSVLEGVDCVRDISPLRVVSEILAPAIDSPLQISRGLSADFFRASHVILAQTHSTDLNSSLSEQRRIVLSGLCKHLCQRDLPEELLLSALTKNASFHPWIPELEENKLIVADLILENLKRRRG